MKTSAKLRNTSDDGFIEIALQQTSLARMCNQDRDP